MKRGVNMNCNIFTENLSKFIEDDLEEGMKFKMEEHMMQCEACRQLYDEELLMEKAFAEALSFEDVSFSSQKEQIMSKIDENKYKSYTPKIVNRGLLGYFKIVGPIAAAILFVVLINPISRFKVMDDLSTENKESLKKAAIEDKANSSNNYIQSVETGDKQDTSISMKEDNPGAKEEVSSKNISENTNNNVTITSTETTEDNNIAALDIQDNSNTEENGDKGGNNKMNSIAGETEDLNKSITFEKQIISSENLNKSFNNNIKSPYSDLSASIADKKDSSIEEIYIEDINKKVRWSLNEDFKDRSVFTSFIKWADNENLFVIIDEVRDNIIISEELYVLNVNNGKAIEVYEIRNNNKKIEDVNKVNEDIELKLSGIKDDNQEKVYVEKYIIDDFPITQDN